ncbi:MAG: tetratricopeptide repeat protein [Fibrobacter sp.]|jgi:tetratricopeptide (TPR) repeat protein|nr:tetratricopeptide repeat protein [Fibrobacter sp.]
MKKLKPIPFLGLLLLALSSCTKSGSPIPSVEPSNHSSAPNAGVSAFRISDLPSESEEVFAFHRNAFSFKVEDLSWKSVGDNADTLAPLEFYQEKNGLRAVINAVKLSGNDDISLVELARAEMQAYESSVEDMKHSEVVPRELFGVLGVWWETSGKNTGGVTQAAGFVFSAGDELFYLTLSTSDSLRSTEIFAAIWKDFFAAFELKASLRTPPSSELSKEIVTLFRSADYAYRWSVKDSLWYHWKSVAHQNQDPDLILSDKSEEAAFAVYGVYVSPDEVSSQDLFKVFLIRLGIDPNDSRLKTNRLRGGTPQQYTQDFEIVFDISGFDFHYQGRYFWDNGRGVLAAGWTQAVLYSKYRKAIQNAVQGVVLETAVSAAETKKQQKFGAVVLNQIGLLRLVEGEPLVALSYFEKANRLDPEEPLYLINCGFVYQQKMLYGPGISHFQAQIELVKKSAHLLYILGAMYEVIHDYGNARKYAEAALEFIPNAPEYTINLSDALWGLGQRNSSLLVVRNLYQKQPSARLGIYLAKTYMGLDHYAEGVEVLYDVRRRFSMSTDLGLTLMSALVFLGRYEEALAASEETIRMAPKDYRVLSLRGKIQFYLKNFKEAEKTLTRALDLKPDDETARSFLSASQAFLGKADNRAIQKPITPVEAAPENLKSLLSKNTAAEARQKGYPAAVHWTREALRAEKGKPWVRSEQLLMEVLDERGAAIYSEFGFTFLPGFDRIYLNALNVYDSTLKLKHSFSLQNAYITYATELGTSNESQRAHFPLPALAPGDFIYLHLSRTNLDGRDVIPFTDYVSSREIPVGVSSFRIYADTSRFVAEEYGPLERTVFENGKEWRIENPVVIRNELFMPVYRDFGAGLMLTGKEKWAEVGRDYENLIRHQFKNAVAVREKAFEVSGNKIGKEAVLVVVRWVRENIRYRDVPFGGHSLIPQLSEVTLKEYRGDCKDQSLLLKEMLATIGVPSYLAAIHLSEMGYENLPTIQQFNHMLVYIPAGKNYPEMWVDPTDKAGNDRPVPLDMEGKYALIIDGDQSRIVETPILEDNQEHQAHFHHQLFIGENGVAEFRDSLTLKGKFASAFRNQFLGKDQKEQEVLLAGLLSQGIPDVSISLVKTENLRDFNKPFIVVVTFSSSLYFGQSTQNVKGNFPNVWERSLMRLPQVNERHHPIRMPHEAQFESILTVSSQTGTPQVEYPPAFSREMDYVSYEKKGNRIRWTTFALYADPSEYEKIREEWDYLIRLTSPQITME